MRNTTQLRTRRLLLRAYRNDDIPAMIRLIGAREVAATTLRIPHPYTEQDARSFLRQIRDNESSTCFAICLLESGEMCGGIGLNLEDVHDRAELGYWIGVPYWGHGYATEAAAEIVRYGFEELKLNRIFAHHMLENTSSGRILQKIGMTYEGRLHQHIRKWGRFVDVEIYGILAEQWKAARL